MAEGINGEIELYTGRSSPLFNRDKNATRDEQVSQAEHISGKIAGGNATVHSLETKSFGWIVQHRKDKKRKTDRAGSKVGLSQEKGEKR
ncbi:MULTISPECIES: hypothetical protein [Desulfosediminicola]|uniref:hypothetical protein n=1 Tax=Desulfosediminicola TaxID=2886823 RepID=UPI0010ACEA2F|nr:hypothetical protein [Desulfosediminicola ganghwensis]